MIKTGFSFNTAVGKMPEILSRLSEIGWRHAPICDRGGTQGHVRWKKACTNLTPVYGVELAVTKDKTAAKPVVDYWTFLPRETMRPLNELIYKATSNPRGGDPMVTYEEAHAADVIRIAHEATDIEATDWSRTWLGLTPATPVHLWKRAKERGAKHISCPRNVFPRKDDLEFYRVMLGRRSGTQTYPQWIVSDDELAASVKWMAKTEDVANGIENRLNILDMSVAQLGRAELLIPNHPDTLENMCRKGAEKIGVDLSNKEYEARLERELELIEQKNFSDYFYLLAEMVNWAKDRMVVGPARGSSCGSLVCYLLGITAIDPLRHGLIFERFIDVTRTDLPDVDLDFSAEHRDEVFAHLEELYPGKIARLGSVIDFEVKSALNYVGAALSIPKNIVSAVAETAIKRKMGDSRKDSTMEDTLKETDAGKKMIGEYPESMIAARFEEHPKNAGRHAAGVVATNGRVLDYVAMNARTGVAMCDKYDADTLNMLKVDILGLTQLSVFERAMKLIGVKPISGWHEKLPLDDPKAFEVLNDQKYSGIFQFEASAMRGLAKQIKFESLNDIIAAGALVRPGPMASGNTEKWVRRRAGKEAAEYAHPLLEPYLKNTYGIPAYQEQVLMIGREIGDLSWEEVTKLRQAMSKSLGKEFFSQFGNKFIAGAKKRGMPEEIASKFFDDMTNFGAWAFNLSHSVAYAYVSYWSCWWKAHHPVEYACACLDMEGDPDKQIELLKELKSEGIEYVPVDPERSRESWTPLEEGGRKFVLGPLSNVVGIGPSKVREILERRKMGIPLTPGLAKKLNEPKTMLDSLTPIRQWVEKKYPNGELASKMNIVSKQTFVEDIQIGHGDLLAIVVPTRLMPKDENEPVKLAKRNGRRVDPSASLVMFLKDDTGEILAKINADIFERVGRPMAERGRVGKAVYAIKGKVGNFRMIWVDRVKYLGDLSE